MLRVEQEAINAEIEANLAPDLTPTQRVIARGLWRAVIEGWSFKPNTLARFVDHEIRREGVAFTDELTRTS